MATEIKHTQKKLQDVNYVIKVLSFTAWTSRNLPEELKSKSKRILAYQILYTLIVGLACCLSFLALITPAKEWQEQWTSAIKVLQIIGFFTFIADYVLHWITYSYYHAYKNSYERVTRYGWLKFLISGTGLLILLCILSSLNVLNYFKAGAFDASATTNQVLSSFNLIKMFRLLILLKLLRPIENLLNVLDQKGKVLFSVFMFIVLIIIIFALLIWNNESEWLREQQNNWIKTHNTTKELAAANPEYQALSNGVVKNFLEALYFATITLTTIGYGDFVPHAVNSRVIVMVISILGIAIIAIPSGIIAGSFMAELKEKQTEKDEEKRHKREKLEQAQDKLEQANKN
ncbi:two pore domain potassium channel family protein [[Mycoplasma] falconis]|uniref:Two pore domain potassium channel family protein n=1 Tax=[Mycoplasma] falconis TaxID=92403 RepID=A0A501XAW3_9BACT|nr:potassium channel family protein [[Mycoplasma] falconis]TPE57768.1 two pore domain potassium channel family protein [[Mycoplasma] falconis]